MALAHSIWTALLLLIFIGIVLWAWSARRAPQFAQAGRAPLDEDGARAEDRDDG